MKPKPTPLAPRNPRLPIVQESTPTYSSRAPDDPPRRDPEAALRERPVLGQHIIVAIPRRSLGRDPFDGEPSLIEEMMRRAGWIR